MAMTKCKECGHEVSTKALACPSCGAARPRPWGLGKKIVGGFVILVGISFIYGIGSEQSKPEPPPKTPEQLAKEQQARAQNSVDAARVRALRDAMKNPGSFALVSALRMDDGTICVEYRATNSFNAVVSEYKAIASDGRIVDWNSWCGGKSGVDRTSYLKALL